MVDINNHMEVNAISESCQILSDTLDLVEKSIFPGQSVLELDKIAENYISSCNAKPAFKGYDGFPATLTVSIDDEIVHGIPKDVVLVEGQIVSIDCGVIKNDFYSDSARTIAVGKISEEEGHHPDISFGWGYAEVKITTHAIKGLSENDFILAAKIDKVTNV